MLRMTAVFSLALVSGVAAAGSLADAVNGVLGIGGPSAAPLSAPLSGALSGPLSAVETGATAVTDSAPLPGLAPAKASGNTFALGVLNQGEPVVNGCAMGECMSTSDIPMFGASLNGGGNTLSTTSRNSVLIPAGRALSPLSALEAANASPLPAKTALFGGPSHADNTPNSTVNVAVLSGDNSGDGGTVGVAVGTTDNPSTSKGGSGAKAANAQNVGVGVLNGSAAAPPPTGGPVVDPGSNPDGNKESAQSDDESQLCSSLAKDNRGDVKGKLREKAHCHKLKSPKA